MILDWLADRLPLWLDWRSKRVIDLACVRLLVIAGECRSIDYGKIEKWARAAQTDFSAAVNRKPPKVAIRLRGVRAPTVAGKPVYGCTAVRRRVVLFRCGVEEVVRHELFHQWAFVMALPYYRLIDHKPGYTLDGTPQ